MSNNHSKSLNNNHSSFKTVTTPPQLSVLVPVHDEAGNIAPLINEIRAALEGQIIYELIYIDDGSTDNSWQELHNIASHFKKLRIIRHRHSYGQSLAIITGVKAARAEWIVTLDGDGQNDPADIPRLLIARQQNSHLPQIQMIAGYRRQRHDNWFKRFSSRLANQIRRSWLHDNTLDTGCSLKLFSRSAFLALPHFNHMHRFLHALFRRNGGQIISLEVNHRPRRHGKSKYGLFNRLGVGMVDLLGVKWLQRRPVLAEIFEEENDK